MAGCAMKPQVSAGCAMKPQRSVLNRNVVRGPSVQAEKSSGAEALPIGRRTSSSGVVKATSRGSFGTSVISPKSPGLPTPMSPNGPRCFTCIASKEDLKGCEHPQLPIAAGHRSGQGKSTLHMMDSEDVPEFVYKPFCLNERDSYLRLMSSPNDPVQEFTPRFHGMVRVSENQDEQFTVLSNCLLDFSDPRVMDVKLGMRSFLETEITNPTLRADLYKKMLKECSAGLTEEEKRCQAITKLRWLNYRDSSSTSRELGYRIEGVTRDAKSKLEEDVEPTSSHETFRTRDGATKALRDFMRNEMNVALALQGRLEQLRQAMENSAFVASSEIIGSSLLLVVDAHGRCGVFWIDFGKTVVLPQDMQGGHSMKWEKGNHADGVFLGLDNLIQATSEIAATAERTRSASSLSGESSIFSDYRSS